MSRQTASPDGQDASTKLNALRDCLQAALEQRSGPAILAQPCCVVVSVTDGKRRAVTRHWSGSSLDAVWQAMSSQFLSIAKGLDLDGLHLRVDYLVDLQTTRWSELKQTLGKTKRNYFSHGIALGDQFQYVFLNQELNGNAMLYGSNQNEYAQLHRENFIRYGRAKYGAPFKLDDGDDSRVCLFNTLGVYFGPGQPKPFVLQVDGVRAGSRITEDLNPESCEQFIASGSEFLSTQVDANGRFVYGLFPCFDREVASYNTLRHASTTYAMIEAWEVSRSETLKASIERALACLENDLIKLVNLPGVAGANQVAFLVDTGDEIKLGGNAVCILALCKYTELTGDRRYLTLLKKLANGIAAMFNPETGQFVHVLSYPDLGIKERFRIIYYDGEAAFALMRLYRIVPYPMYLQIVEKAFEYFINAGHDNIHDHWLSYCVNELTIHRPERKYFEFGIRNFSGHLDFVLNRITTFPTLLELMMAAEQMLQRMQSDETLHDLLATVDLGTFYRALHHRANYLLSGYFWPEWAMFFKNPKRIVGSFFIRHHAFRVRIDDIEHYLSGLVAYRKFLLERTPVTAPGAAPQLAQSSQTAQTDWQQTQVWFLNQNIGFKRSGVENASLMRATLFASSLGKPVTLLTAEYNPELSASVEQLKQRGQLHPDVSVYSIYDRIQQALPGSTAVHKQQYMLPLANKLIRQPVEDEIDFKWLDSRGRLLMYEVFSRETGKLLYINHFSGGKKIRRDRYDARGFLSQSQVLNPDLGLVLLEQFFRPDGSVALEKFYSQLNGKAVLDHIRVVNSDRQVYRVLQSEEDLIATVLQDCLQGDRQSHLLVADKNRVYYKPAARARCELGTTQPIRLAAFIHSVHTQSLVQLEHSPLNSNYAAIFDAATPCDSVWVSTDEQAQDIRNRFPGTPVASVAQAYDPSLVPSGFETRDRFRVVMLARLGHEKRIDLAIKAFADVALQVPQARLDIFGFSTSGAAHEESLHKLIESLGLAEKVCLKGWCANPAAEYESAGLCMLTSEKEGFSLSLMEAVRHGCPAVAFQVRYGPSDIVIQGKTGFLVPFGDTSALAQAMVRILQDEILHRQLSENARVSGQRFSTEQLALRWREILVSLGYSGV